MLEKYNLFSLPRVILSNPQKDNISDSCDELHPIGFINSDDSKNGPSFTFFLAKKKIFSKTSIRIAKSSIQI